MTFSFIVGARIGALIWLHMLPELFWEEGFFREKPPSQRALALYFVADGVSGDDAGHDHHPHGGGCHGSKLAHKGIPILIKMSQVLRFCRGVSPP